MNTQGHIYPTTQSVYSIKSLFTMNTQGHINPTTQSVYSIYYEHKVISILLHKVCIQLNHYIL